MKNASEIYYYCQRCQFFHENGKGHERVNRHLCFICWNIQDKNTKICGNSDIGYTQVCEKCYNKIVEFL